MSLLICMLIIVTCSRFARSTTLPLVEVNALMKGFFEDLDGENWDYGAVGCQGIIGGSPKIDGNVWNTSTTPSGDYIYNPCDFFGVDCKCTESACTVDTIQLCGGNLKGSFPVDSILALSNLSILDMRYNFISGSLPDMSSLANLEALYLSGNHLEGTLDELTVTGGSLPNLKQLYLDQNLISGRLRGMKDQNFDLSNNTGFARLISLEVLNLDKNQFTGTVPPVFSDRTNLINLSNNYFQGPLSDITFRGCSIRILDLSKNRLTGTIPQGFFAQLSIAAVIILDHNTFTGVIPDGPTGISRLYKIEQLSLEYNAFSGSLPASIGRLCCAAKLTTLVLSHNRFEGRIPDMQDLEYLEDLRLDHNLFTGSLHEDDSFGFINPLWQLELRTLSVAFNLLKGEVSATPFLLPNIEVLALDSNCFSGALPSKEICTANTLKTLILSGLSSGATCRDYFFSSEMRKPPLQFDGFLAPFLMSDQVLPVCMFNLPHLETLYVSGNAFLGQLPKSISPSLRYLDVSHNQLNGDIPCTFAQANLTRLHMSHNRIFGSLSCFDDIVPGPDYDLTLSVNQLSGTIPISMNNVHNLQILDGNMLACSSRKDLPSNDPLSTRFICGSNNLDTQMYVYAGVSFLTVLLYFIGSRGVKRQWFRNAFYRYRDQLELWYNISTGSSKHMELILAPLQETELGREKLKFQFSGIRRYSIHLIQLRQFLYQLGVVLMILLILYTTMAGSEFRSIEHTYLWVTTSAYMTGDKSTTVLLVFWVTLVFGIRYLIYRDKDVKLRAYLSKPGQHLDMSVAEEQLHQARDKFYGQGLKDTHNSRWRRVLQGQVLPFLRILIIVSFSIVVNISANVGFMLVLLNGTESQQRIASYSLAAFKQGWQMVVTPRLFQWRILMFGVNQRLHYRFEKILAGSKTSLYFVLICVNSVVVPIVVASMVDPSCFYHVLYSPVVDDMSYNVPKCDTFSLVNGELVCSGTNLQASIDVDTRLPYVYNYTCTGSILKAYVPVFIQLYVLIILKNVFHFIVLLLHIHMELNDQDAKDESDRIRDLNLVSKNDPLDVSKYFPHTISAQSQIRNFKEAHIDRLIELIFTRFEDSNDEGTASEAKYIQELEEITSTHMSPTKEIERIKKRADKSMWRRGMDLLCNTFPSRKLLMDHDNRHISYLTAGKDMFMIDAVHSNYFCALQLGAILLILTFGVMAPMLGIVLVCALAFETLTLQLVLGKFILSECSILILYAQQHDERNRREGIARNKKSVKISAKTKMNGNATSTTKSISISSSGKPTKISNSPIQISTVKNALHDSAINQSKNIEVKEVDDDDDDWGFIPQSKEEASKVGRPTLTHVLGSLTNIPSVDLNVSRPSMEVRVSEDRAFSFANKVSMYNPAAALTRHTMKLGMGIKVAESTEPWGSISALHLVESEVSLLPVSVLNMGRRIYVLGCSFLYAVMLNDMNNNGQASGSYIKPGIMLLFVPLVELGSVLFTRYKVMKELAKELDTELGIAALNTDVIWGTFANKDEDASSDEDEYGDEESDEEDDDYITLDKPPLKPKLNSHVSQKLMSHLSTAFNEAFVLSLDELDEVHVWDDNTRINSLRESVDTRNLL
jgi:Leucine-rich repeat (LRR) protein